MIQKGLLGNVADFINGKIHKVVLNEIYEITDIELKQVEENVVVMNYLVPFSEISTLEKIELKDKDNNVLSSNEVDVPLTADTLMIQTISVREGLHG